MVALVESLGELAAEVWQTVRGIGPATAAEVHGDLTQRVRLGLLLLVSRETVELREVESTLAELVARQVVEIDAGGRFDARPLAAIAGASGDVDDAQLRLFV